MTSYPLQFAKRPAKAERQIFRHSQADNYVRFLCAVSMLRDCGKAHPDEAFLVGQFGEQIDMQGRVAVIKYHKPFAVEFDLSDCSRHGGISLRKTEVKS